MLGASCGIDSPSKFNKEHIALRESNNDVSKFKDAAIDMSSASAQITRIEDIKHTKEQEKEVVKS